MALGEEARMRRETELPPFVSPMLLKKASPFDSDDHIFEVKWDGARALALVGVSSYRLFSRHQVDITECFPELGFLRRLPPGTLLDGEVVIVQDGKPDFSLLLSRLGTRGELKTRVLARTGPATYVAFDQLYDDYEPLLRQPASRHGFAIFGGRHCRSKFAARNVPHFQWDVSRSRGPNRYHVFQNSFFHLVGFQIVGFR